MSSILKDSIFRRGRLLKDLFRDSRAFSLVEVVMAIGITAFATFAIAGLIPVGLNSFRQTKNVGTAANISRQVFSQLQSTPFSDITKQNTNGGSTSWRLSAPNSSVGSALYVRFYNEQGEELAGTAGATTSSNVPTGTLYEVNVGVRYAPFLPAGASPLGSTVNTNLVIVVVQVAYNPGHQSIDYADASNPSLWVPTANGGKTPILTFNYQTMIAGDATALDPSSNP